MCGVHEVFGQLPREPQHHGGHRGRGLVGFEALGIFAYDAKRQLPQLGFAEQPAVGLDRQQQAVLAQQVPCERVVGAHGGRVVGDVAAAGNEACAGQPCQPGANPSQQLTRGLAGERQTEHLTRPGVAVGDQPYHPCCHRFRLARSRARDHDERTGWRGDHRLLFLGRREKA